MKVVRARRGKAMSKLNLSVLIPGIGMLVCSGYVLITGNIRWDVYIGDDRYFIGLPVLLSGLYLTYLPIKEYMYRS